VNSCSKLCLWALFVGTGPGLAHNQNIDQYYAPLVRVEWTASWEFDGLKVDFFFWRGNLVYSFSARPSDTPGRNFSRHHADAPGTRSHLSNVCTDSLGGIYSGRLRFPRHPRGRPWRHFDRIAEANHFIAIFPEAFAGNWNDGRENEMAQSYRQDIDDVAFVDKILEKVKTEYPIDLHRIYAAGFSNGAIFCHYLAASRSTLFAAIAPVSGQLAFPFSKRFRPKDSVSVLEIHGTTDPVVPYHGGRITDDGGEVIGVEETVEYWSRADCCKSRYLQLPMADLNPNDDCYPEKFLWADGRHDTDVVLCRVVGGGHTWPGSTLPFYFFFLGNVCLDFDASQMIWNFFRSHPKAEPTAALKGAVESSAHPGRLTGSLQNR
jgi:polyhydroxybutyrate depolymerase